MPRYRIVFRGPVSRGLIGWLDRLIPILRQVPKGTEVTVEIKATEDGQD